MSRIVNMKYSTFTLKQILKEWQNFCYIDSVSMTVISTNVHKQMYIYQKVIFKEGLPRNNEG